MLSKTLCIVAAGRVTQHTCQPSWFYRDYPAKRALIPASRHEVQNSRFLHMRPSLAYARIYYIYVRQAPRRALGAARLACMLHNIYIALRARARRQYCTYCSVLVYRTTTILYMYIYCCIIIDDQDLIGCTSAIVINVILLNLVN